MIWSLVLEEHSLIELASAITGAHVYYAARVCCGGFPCFTQVASNTCEACFSVSPWPDRPELDQGVYVGVLKKRFRGTRSKPV